MGEWPKETNVEPFTINVDAQSREKDDSRRKKARVVGLQELLPMKPKVPSGMGLMKPFTFSSLDIRDGRGSTWEHCLTEQGLWESHMGGRSVSGVACTVTGGLPSTSFTYDRLLHMGFVDGCVAERGWV